MKQYKHKNYDEYVQAQIEKNEKKLKLVWVKEREIISIVDRIKRYIPNPEFGLCHGVRNAWEVRKFKKLLKIKVLGTDIAPSVNSYENTIQWDFHEVKDEWINNVDFIYSNSFDHSYDPRMCLDKWMSCIKKKTGICFIHWMATNATEYDAADCFAASLKEYRKLFRRDYFILEEFGTRGRIIFAIKHKQENEVTQEKKDEN